MTTWHKFDETPKEDAVFYCVYTKDDDAPIEEHTYHRMHRGSLQIQFTTNGEWTSVGSYSDYINKNRHIYCGYWAYVDDQPYTYHSNIKLTCQRCPICGKEDSLKPIISNLAGDVKSRIDPATGKSVYYKRCNNCGFRTVHDALFVERNGIL